MKNPDLLHLRKLLVALFCIFTTLAFSQSLIIERINISKDSRYKAESNFNKKLYILSYDKDHQKIYQNTHLKKTEKYNKNNVTLTLNTTEGESGPNIVSIYNENGDFYFPETMPGATSILLSLPAGIYDVFLGYSKNGKDHIVIREQVDVASDKTIIVSPDEADNYIVSKMYNQSGQMLEPGLIDSETGEITGGNTVYSMGDFGVYFNPIKQGIATYALGWSFKNQENEDPAYSFYVNDVSTRYSFSTNVFAIGQNDDLYFNKFGRLNGITNPVILQNNPQDYVFHSQKIQPSAFAMENGLASYGFATLDIMNKYPMFGWTIFSNSNVANTDEKMKFYLNNPIDTVDNFLVYPVLKEAAANGGQQALGIGTGHISKGTNRDVVFGSQASSLNSFFLSDFTYFDGKGMKILPQHPRFSFASKEEIIPGNSTPINVSAFIDVNFMTNYIGHFGEKRETDFITTQVEVKQNNNTVYQGDYAGFSNYSFGSGKYDITFTNTNISVDEIAGRNETKIFFDKNIPDSFPPTLQFLQFRNSAGQVTDRLATGSDGTVRLAAGDFKFNIDQNNNYSYDYVLGNSAKFFYSKHNQNSWTELPLTNYPEYFQMPAFGDYYEGSLKDVIVPEDNTWFDVKVICTDASGNKQEQIVSPAFKIAEKTLAVADVKRFDFTVYPNPFKDELNIQFPENVEGNVTFRVTDMAEKTVYTQTYQNEKSFVFNGASLPKGVYIVTIENNGKVVTKKVIKR